MRKRHFLLNTGSLWKKNIFIKYRLILLLWEK